MLMTRCFNINDKSVKYLTAADVFQISMTSPIVWTSSFVLVEMERCCMPLHSFRYSARSSQKKKEVCFMFPTETTILSRLQDSVPPVMAFHLGSLGFLTPFKFDTYQTQVTQIIEGTECSRTLLASGAHSCFVLRNQMSGTHTCGACVAGNAAIVLRSRLQVQVLKENWEEKDAVDEKGLILTNGEHEMNRKAMQYQVHEVFSHNYQTKLLKLYGWLVLGFGPAKLKYPHDAIMCGGPKLT